MEIEKQFLSVQDVASDLGLKTIVAKELIRKLNNMRVMEGKLAITDIINREFYEKVKASGFEYRPERYEVPIEKRLWWSLEEFAQMCAGAMSRDRAKKHLEDIGLLSWNGNKQIVNRIAYEEWSRENSSSVI